MTERPILFSAPMVRAILDGTKTQTRREFKTRNGGVWPNINDKPGMRQILRNCPYGQPGDKLLVREAWRTVAGADNIAPRDLMNVESFTHYEADEAKPNGMGKLRPSMFMPRWASRINLEITKVRVERLQDINRGDAMAEGCPFTNMAAGDDPRQWYADLWDAISGPGSWATNPWVWVVEFNAEARG